MQSQKWPKLFIWRFIHDKLKSKHPVLSRHEICLIQIHELKYKPNFIKRCSTKYWVKYRNGQQHTHVLTRNWRGYNSFDSGWMDSNSSSRHLKRQNHICGNFSRKGNTIPSRCGHMYVFYQCVSSHRILF